MFKIFAAAGAVFFLASTAQADDPGQPLRLIGDAPTIGAAGPAHFAIDARVRVGSVDGWFTPLPAVPEGSAAVNGQCENGRCELKISATLLTLNLSGDLQGVSGPASGTFEVPGDADTPTVKGAVKFTPFIDTLPGLGALARRDAVDGKALADLFLWDLKDMDQSDDDPRLLGSLQRDELKLWQKQNQRPESGLLSVADLDLLMRQRAERQKALGWTALKGTGWSAGYPAALLPQASRNGREQRFASADGAASLVLAIDPPVGEQGLDKLGTRLSDAHSSMSLSQSGDHLQATINEHDTVTTVIYQSRPGGLARFSFTRPDGDNAYAKIESMITGQLKVDDDLKPAP